MDLPRLLEVILNFIANWAGTTVPRIAAAFLGILVCVLIIVAIWDRRIRTVGASFGLACALLLIAVAIDTRIMHFLVRTSHITRIRILMSVISFVVLVITIESIRRSRLQERYALLWLATGLIILFTAFFPQLLDIIRFVFGTQYVTSVVGVLFAFLLLISFHFSIALSGFQRHQARIAQRFAILEQRINELSGKVLENQNAVAATDDSQFDKRRNAEKIIPVIPKRPLPEKSPTRRRFAGSRVAVLMIIFFSVAAVFTLGALTPQAMIGDEVTHFYMAVEQSHDLSQPNFLSRIPTAWGKNEKRRYPHPFLWHYGAAIAYRISGGSFIAVQAYQALFLGQLLLVAYLLIRNRKAAETGPVLLYLLTLASLPMTLIFSVAFYQDVPMTAQALTAFYFLDRRRWFPATFFIILAMGFKVTAILFLPAFFAFMAYRLFQRENWKKRAVPIATSMAIVFGYVVLMGWTIETYAESHFYPYARIVKAVKDTVQSMDDGKKTPVKKTVKTGKRQDNPNPNRITAYEAEIIANHPGDLRKPENFLIYGGVVLWISMGLGFAGLFTKSKKNPKPPENETERKKDSSTWLFLAGGSFILLTAWLLRSAPDARFFLPGIPFILLPLLGYIVKLPRQKTIIVIIASLSILQGGHVLAKIHTLRQVTPEIQAAIHFLKENPPDPNRVFMYPEGNYRLFPCRHEWYLKYRLRDFWRADNDTRIRMLQAFDIGAVVVKKHLIADVDSEIVDLGVYPSFFVRELKKDSRFESVFENAGVIIFTVPSPSQQRPNEQN